MRIALTIFGTVVAGMGILGDVVGLSSGSGFGFGQIFLCIAGLMLIFAGLSGKRFFSMYRGASLILMNTLLLLLAVEFAALVIIKVFHVDTSPPSSMRDRLQHGQMEETGLIFPSRMFSPFVMWRSEPTELQLMNVDPSGVRRTSCAEDAGSSGEILAFGGSAMWGWMVPDSSTIPSDLQRILNRELGEDGYRIVNLAENGHVSTQELIQLILQLQMGERPSILIFYDGFNDVLASYGNAKAGSLIDQGSLAALFQGRSAPPVDDGVPLLSFLESTHAFKLLMSLKPLPEPSYKGPDILVRPNSSIQDPDFPLTDLADETAEIYLANYAIVQSMSDEMGFDFYFFLQPYLHSGVKTLSANEDSINTETDSLLLDLASMTYSRILEDTSVCPRLIPVAPALRGIETQVFTDICHMTPEGNRLVADYIWERIAEDIRPSPEEGSQAP